MPTYVVKPDVGDGSVGRAYSRIMELHERLKDARTKAGLTQKAVAGHFRIARVSVTQWESGDTRPDPDKFPALADLYGVSLDWLMKESGKGPAASKSNRPDRFIRERNKFKFYVREWREFMGTKVEDAAKVAGLDPNEYQAHEVYPINFTLGQIGALAAEIGVRGDQFWFPPPVKTPQKSTVRISKPGTRSISIPRAK